MATRLATAKIGVAGTDSGTPVASADKRPVRVVVRTRGGAGGLVIFGFDAVSLRQCDSDGTDGNGFTMPTSDREVFTLDCRQTLYAIGTISGIKVCTATSDIPDYEVV